MLSLIAKVSPEWRLNPGFGTQKKCSFNRSNKHKDYVNIFSGTKFCAP